MTENEYNEPSRDPLWKQASTDRESAEREAAFLTWWETHGQPYEAAVIANGDTPWTADIEQRRELFMRRYQRSEPPKGLLTDPRQPEKRVAGAVRHPQRLSPTTRMEDTAA
ncbi:hypothetical protein [Mycolicibacterium helvum]|uniref:Uncharacterized protein n=1 Tax=Mycolicibacterium helvum TaxID=1534349 RepID=A0A7I7T162_9MYCO|nr:hypothetical protein [Mycolicibacterium helvum]BBY62189.1 hypothetical protein MHEL_04320 [Mycolicibacterium helvum]